MKEKAKAHNAPHSERFDPPGGEEPPDITPTGTGWVPEEEPEHPHRPDPPHANPGRT